MSQTATTMGERVPNDVVEGILGQLPVKSLTQFRCVSKSWDSIITDPTFITKHFKLNLNQSESLISTNAHTSRVYDLDHIIYLWNPSIRMFKKLLSTPFTNEDNKIYTMSVVGLAYNSQNNDFKILRLLSVLWGEAEAEIYSLSTDSWRKVVISMESLRGYEPNFGRIFQIDPPCIFLNGVLHTVAYTSRHPFILSFDVNDESFREMLLPFNHIDVVTFSHHALFKGSLALFCFCWLFYGCTDKGELLIKNATGLISFDPENQKQNILAIEDADWVGFTANSMESLILLNGASIAEFVYNFSWYF
uniref:F-box domain-containing protein n=1 Tax=Quercus lobata TaxID=97700 RepID=A0A7N2RB33_QUELO